MDVTRTRDARASEMISLPVAKKLTLNFTVMLLMCVCVCAAGGIQLSDGRHARSVGDQGEAQKNPQRDGEKKNHAQATFLGKSLRDV